jgi:hypothetical protein
MHEAALRRERGRPPHPAGQVDFELGYGAPPHPCGGFQSQALDGLRLSKLVVDWGGLDVDIAGDYKAGGLVRGHFTHMLPAVDLQEGARLQEGAGPRAAHASFREPVDSFASAR